MQQLPLGVRLNEAARFETFVAGKNRELVGLLSGGKPPRVLWLWGRAGSGKSHLLQAACADVGERGGAAAYVDLARAAGPGMLEGLEVLDLVCIDSLDLVAGDENWNGAIFRLHTLMQDAGGRLLVASAAPPSALCFRLPDLRSRLLAAPVHQLKDLDEAGRIEVLARRAAARGLELPPEAVSYLLQHQPRDMHSLCGLLDRLDEASLAAQRRLTVPFLRQVLEGQRSSES
jgi:DnaA family protein